MNIHAPAPSDRPALYRMLPRAIRIRVESREILMRSAAIASRNHRAVADFWSTVASPRLWVRGGYDATATQELLKCWGEFMTSVAYGMRGRAEHVPQQILDLVENGADPNAVDVRDLFNPIELKRYPGCGFGDREAYADRLDPDFYFSSSDAFWAAYPVPPGAMAYGPYSSIARLLKQFVEHGYSLDDELLGELAQRFESRSNRIGDAKRFARDKAMDFANHHSKCSRHCRVAVDDPLGIHGGNKSDRLRWRSMLNA